MSSMTSVPILTPEFRLEPGRCNPGCALNADHTLVTNVPGAQPEGARPFAFLGAHGSVDLAPPALHYWTVQCCVTQTGHGHRCEFGLASLASLDTCGPAQRVSDHDVTAATLVLVRDGDMVTLDGRDWSKDLDTPPPPQGRDVTYMCLWEKRMRCWTSPSMEHLNTTFELLYDNRQPQSPRLLVVENSVLVGVRQVPPSPDLCPVLRLWPSSDALGGADASLGVETGPAILTSAASDHLHSLLGQMAAHTAP